MRTSSGIFGALKPDGAEQTRVCELDLIALD